MIDDRINVKKRCVMGDRESVERYRKMTMNASTKVSRMRRVPSSAMSSKLISGIGYSYT